MATTFNLDLAECIEEAFERASSGEREMRTGYDFHTARRSLNLLLADWANRGINMWTIEQGDIPLVQGVSRYALPTDTVDIIEHAIRQFDGNITQQSDISITRISVSTFSNIPNKLSTGMPIQLYVERTVTGPYVNLWPVPQNNNYKLVYWRLRRMNDVANGGDVGDIPFRLLPALIAGLAYNISMKIPEGRRNTMDLKLQYDEAWQLASEEDRDRATLKLVPLGY
jgi:hypothetical protein